MTDDMEIRGGYDLDTAPAVDEDFDDDAEGDEAEEIGLEEAIAEILSATEAIHERIEDLLAEQQDTNRFLAMLVAATGRPQDASEAAAYLEGHDDEAEPDDDPLIA